MRRPRFKPSIASTRYCRFSPGRAERHGFEYYRHGTLSLYAALDTATGRVHGKTAARHTSRDFVGFLKEVVSLCPPDQQIHIILDNLSAHKPRWCGSSWSNIPASGSTSHPPTPHGSIRSNSGSRKSSGRSSPAASLPPCPIWPASCAATSTLTQPMLSLSTGSTPTFLTASVVTISLRQATSRPSRCRVHRQNCPSIWAGRRHHCTDHHAASH